VTGDSAHRAFGFDALDAALGGGLPAGKLSLLAAPADSQSELLLERITTEHEALYVPTERPAEEVTEQLLAAGDDPMPTDVAQAEPGELLYDEAIGETYFPEDGVVVVDPVDAMEEAEREPYLRLLANLRSAAASTGSAVLLHCRRGEDPPALRSTTLGRVDLAMELRRVFHTRKVETYLTIGKHRGGTARVEPIKLVLTDDVEVDTSRDIA
jgi:hypothetical protein